MKGKIFVLSGTSDGRAIIEGLAGAGYQVFATTATDYGASLIGSSESVTVLAQRLTQDEMTAYIRREGVALIVDATHPYASAVSENAMAAARAACVPYLRFERQAERLIEMGAGVECVDGYEAAALYLQKTGGNILLTTGSNHLEVFAKALPLDRLCVRVLPTVEAIEKCESLGFRAHQIIALQGPFSEAMNAAIYKDYQIQHLVTKNSGAAGGMAEKIASASKCGVQVLVIERPKLNYPNVYSNLDETLERVAALM